MQFDLFDHSRDVVLRNDVFTALRERNPGTANEAIAALADEYRDDPFLPALRVLAEALLPIPRLTAHDTAAAALSAIENVVVPAAATVFGDHGKPWLAPLWRQFADAAAGLEFDHRHEQIHAAAFSLRAGDWHRASERVARIAGWRRQPAPLAWMAEALGRDPAHDRGLPAAWPLLVELAWIAPRRFADLVDDLGIEPLATLRRRFDQEFEGEGGTDDYSWFPAWACIADAGLAAGIRAADVQRDTTAERCARLIGEILTLERQGKQRELVAARARLKGLHAGLFADYMRSR